MSCRIRICNSLNYDDFTAKNINIVSDAAHRMSLDSFVR